MKCIKLAPRQSESDGYSESRRHVIFTTPFIMAGLIAAPSRLFAALDESIQDAEVDEFIASTAAEAAALKEDGSASGQDAYVKHVAEAVSHIRNVPTSNLSTSSWKGFDPGVFLGDLGRNQAFFIVHFALEPDAFLPPHCHPSTSVCTLGIEGSATLRHFEPLNSAPDYRSDRETEFLVRETRRLMLREGLTSTLTEQRDNIHLFEAGPRGARGIDVTTDYGGDGSFSFLDFDRNRPVETGSDRYLARWIGSNI